MGIALALEYWTAVDKLTVKLQFGKYNYLVEADISGYFDNIDHDWLLKMLAERVDDKSFLWLIGKWLKAGVLETDGKVVHPLTGTPQGGIVSPLLANIYLHFVLDLWFHKVVIPNCSGEACLIRYADDFVCAFEKEEDAQSVLQSPGGTVEEIQPGTLGRENPCPPVQFFRASGMCSFRLPGL